MAKTTQKYLDALGIHNLHRVITAYNPWWEEGKFNLPIPGFHRDAFRKAEGHIVADHNLALLINGPRRIGKTTLMYQLIKHLMHSNYSAAKNILFFSLDDPIIQQLQPRDQGTLFELMLDTWATYAGTALRNSPHTLYCFLDEIQRLPRWELYIKRYVDLRYPIRFIISGSASHTIFRKSLESLIGRIVDISLPPFTFREYSRNHYDNYANILEQIASEPFDISNRYHIQKYIGLLSKHDLTKNTEIARWDKFSDEYAQAGGFPQLWDISDTTERSSYIDQHYVQRVTLEDLRLVKEIRRPEIFNQFLRYAFARTGDEYNLEKLAALIHTTRVTLASALPILLQTELIRRVERFSGRPIRLRSTHAKLYSADPILTQAITKISTSLNGDNRGQIAETLVHNIIRLLPGISSDIYYFKERRAGRDWEVDFIVRVGSKIIPIEVAYQKTPDINHFDSLKNFLTEYSKHASFAILVTRNTLKIDGPVIRIPLALFLLLG